MGGARGGRHKTRDSAGRREDLLNELAELEGQVGRWVPDCGKEYEYTYNYTAEVDDCPVSDKDQERIEGAAEAACRAVVEGYCKRTENCKTLRILSSEPVGGGCNCVSVLGRKKCVQLVNWKIKYKCDQAT